MNPSATAAAGTQKISRSIALIIILYCISSSICLGETFYIDPSAASNGFGTQASPYNTWDGLTLRPGNTYLQKAGTTYKSQLTIVHNNTATSGSPIILDRYGSGAKPIIHNLFIGDLSYFTFQNLSFPFGVLQDSRFPDDHLTWNNNDFSNPSLGAGLGFYAAGIATNEVWTNNTFHDTLKDCMTLHTINNGSANGSQFKNNNIFNCGRYGISLWTSWAIVSGNIVHTTGLHPQAAGGGSAIHVYNGCFGTDPCGTEGHDNLITRNVVYDAHDNLGDGNGIQSDQMTHNNTITQNLSFSNDGEGLSLYDSANNVVNQNVFFNNGMDRSFSHSLRGNITLDASTRFYGTHGNSIVNNTAIVSDIGATAGMLGTGPFGFEVSSPAGLNSYGGNKLLTANSARGSMHNYNWWNARPIPPTQGNDIAFWNGNSNSNRVHTAPDVFGSVTITSTVGAPPMDFILPTAYQIPVLYNGAVLTLYGWRADNGLYGTYPGGAESSKGTIVPTVGPAFIDSSVADNGVVKAVASESQPKSPLIRRLPRGVAALAALPDVIVTSLSYNTATGIFRSVMKNQGAAATPTGTTLGIAYLVDGVQQTWGTVMGPLAAGASVTIGDGGGAYQIPSGTHTITAVADAPNRFTESDRTNNTLSQTITISGSSLPDVIVTSLSYNAATGAFNSVVKNQGVAATPAGVTVGVSYSVDGLYRTWGSVMGPLAAGASVTIGNGGGAYHIPSGTHTITAFADDINRFAESNETNNTLSQTITIGGSSSECLPSTIYPSGADTDLQATHTSIVAALDASLASIAAKGCPTVPDTPHGMNNTRTSVVAAPNMVAAHQIMQREGVWWEQVTDSTGALLNPARDLPAYDYFYANFPDHGLILHWSIGSGGNNPPGVSFANKAAAYQTMATFMANMVARYPNVVYWELMNEPDQYGTSGSRCNVSCGSGIGFSDIFGSNAGLNLYQQGQNYAQMLAVVVPAMKAVNPNVKPILAGLAFPDTASTSFSQGVFDGGGAQYLWAWNIHVYGPIAYRVLDETVMFRTWMNAHGLSGMALVITEWGDNTGPGGSTQQTAECAAYAEIKKYGLTVFDEVYASDDAGWSLFTNPPNWTPTTTEQQCFINNP